jgi:prepilin-type N-terminal cleavage/methylation domain-containing protein
MKQHASYGFTLIEVIIAIVVSAIAMSAILPFLGRVFQLSHEPRTSLQSGLSLQAAMEHLVAFDMANTNNPLLVQSYLHAHGGVYSGQVVAANTFIAFTNGFESTTPAALNLLKVSLRNPETLERMERLFAVPP